MKFLFDLFPIILFFAAFKIYDIYVATAVAIVATILQIGWAKYKNGKVDGMLIASGLIIVVFGGATLLLHDETFIKWKPTVLYWLFGTSLLIGTLLFKKNLIRSMMEKQISMPDAIWNKLNYAWTAFFLLLGCLNLYIAYNFTTEVWVNFKLFGTMILMFAFVIGQSLMISKYIVAKDQE